jgi:hypothetical protein
MIFERVAINLPHLELIDQLAVARQGVGLIIMIKENSLDPSASAIAGTASLAFAWAVTRLPERLGQALKAFQALPI